MVTQVWGKWLKSITSQAIFWAKKCIGVFKSPWLIRNTVIRLFLVLQTKFMMFNVCIYYFLIQLPSHRLHIFRWHSSWLPHKVKIFQLPQPSLTPHIRCWIFPCRFVWAISFGLQNEQPHTNNIQAGYPPMCFPGNCLIKFYIESRKTKFQ